MKPPYHVPSMKEIEQVRGTSGYNIVSTFSGCGGSCLGFEMAGFKVLWASEFIPEARDTYKRNHPGVFLDPRDIRRVKAKHILESIDMQPGELDVLEGSPPCSAFSLAGKREGGWGEVKTYSTTKQRVDDLFFEFARLLKGLQPKVFVAENVAGLVRGSAVGYFKMILRELKSCGYNVKAKVLDAQWLGVPQVRQRLIFIGVREDLNMEPSYPKPFDYSYSVKDAIPGIENSTSVGAGLLPPSRQGDDAFNTCHVDLARPCPTVTIASPGNDLAIPVAGQSKRRKFTIAELKRICGFPDDFVLTGIYRKQWERLGRAVPPVMMFQIAKEVKEGILNKEVQS